jgi:hypothetical protein
MQPEKISAEYSIKHSDYFPTRCRDLKNHRCTQNPYSTLNTHLDTYQKQYTFSRKQNHRINESDEFSKHPETLLQEFTKT